MADTPTNGAAEPPRSLRDVAEEAYNTVVEQADIEESEAPAETEIEQSERQRDERGRFVAKQPAEGEAAAETLPSPPEATQETEQPHPATEQQAPGVAAQAPSNWSAEDRANFEKLPQEGKNFLLRRHSEMEGDYQKRVQATAVSNQFVTAIAPVFDDPDIVASMRHEGKTPAEAIYQWAGFHKRAMNPDDRTRIELLFEFADRMQLDPAAVFGHLERRQAVAFTKEELANPAVKKFADQIAYLDSQLRSQNAVLTQYQQGQERALLDARRSEIDAFADARNPDGSKAHPYFDRQLPVIMELYRSDRSKTIEQCYVEAVTSFLEEAKARAKADLEQQQNLTRAQAAVRSNVRGSTQPVARPPNGEGKQGLRAIVEQSAEEIGF